MKKLMLAAVACAALSGFCLESANVVGYQSVTIPGNPDGASFSLYTVTFKGVGSEGYSIKDIQVLDKDGNLFDGTTLKSENLITIQKISGTKCEVSNDTTYRFNSRVRSGAQVGWHDLAKATTTLDASVKLTDGEGVLISNSQKADIQLRFSGEVEINPLSFAIPYSETGAGFTIFGNFTPCAISIKDIVVLNKDKQLFDGTTLKSENLITIQKINGNKCEVSNDTTYRFNSRVRSGAQVGWHDLAKATTTIDASVKLQPGEAVLVSNSQKEPVYFQLPAPVASDK